MDAELRGYLEGWVKSRDWYDSAKDNMTMDEMIQEELREGDIIFEEVVFSRRWWDEAFVVVSIGFLEIGFIDGRTTGDDSAEDKGFEFDMDSICWAEAYTKQIIGWRPKK
jgi:hypothetical protein